MAASRTELQTVLIGLGVAVALVAVQTAIGAEHRLFDRDPSARETAIACLTDVKGLAVDEANRDPIASIASGGALSTVVEGNPVTLLFANSERQAARIIRLYTRIASDLGPPQLQAREHFVFLWSGEPTPTQLQTVYDCTA
jgi:hypothetical protein